MKPETLKTLTVGGVRIDLLLDCCLGREGYICLAIWTALGLIFYLSTRKGKDK